MTGKRKKLFIICPSIIIVCGLTVLIVWDYYSFRDNLVKYIRSNDSENIEKLLKSRKFYSVNFYINDKEKKQSYTPLFLSVMLEYPVHRNNFKITKFLLENGADVKLNNKSKGKIEYLGEIEDEKFLTEYSIICFILDHYNPQGNYDMEKDILEELLKAGADPDLCFKCNGKLNNSPLILSAMQGNVEFMKLFIKYKANVNFYDIYAFTRITKRKFDVLFASLITPHFPSSKEQFDAVRLIFESGFKLYPEKRYFLGTNKEQTVQEIISERPFQSELVKYLEEKIAEAKNKGQSN